MDFKEIERDVRNSDQFGAVAGVWLRAEMNAYATIRENRDRYSDGDHLALTVNGVSDILSDGAPADAVAFFAARGIAA